MSTVVSAKLQTVGSLSRGQESTRSHWLSGLFTKYRDLWRVPKTGLLRNSWRTKLKLGTWRPVTLESSLPPEAQGTHITPGGFLSA